MSGRIHVVVNPAAGQDRPILKTLNQAFHDAEVDWDLFVTKRAGDGQRLARAAVAAGVDAVAVYGGDGTVMEVASGLIGTDVPLAIFPGGTANVISRELGIPSDLAEACALVCGRAQRRRSIDVGQLGERYFLIRVGLGFEAEMIEGADRDLKDRLGNLAYAISGLKALKDPPIARYELNVDGQMLATEGVTCIIANAGSLGQLDLSLAPTIDVGDGLLDVIVVRKADLPSLLSVAASIVGANESAEPLQHWRGREISVQAEPRQVVQIDGEVLETETVTARVIPGAVQVIVPAEDE
jgi:diacylglycerol kinase (ATP)